MAHALALHVAARGFRSSSAHPGDPRPPEGRDPTTVLISLRLATHRKAEMAGLRKEVAHARASSERGTAAGRGSVLGSVTPVVEADVNERASSGSLGAGCSGEMPATPPRVREVVVGGILAFTAQGRAR